MAVQDYIVDKLDETLIIKLAEPYEKVEQVVGYVDEVIGEDSVNKFERYFRFRTAFSGSIGFFLRIFLGYCLSKNC